MKIQAVYSDHESKKFYVAILPASLICRISYASVRRQDSEEGAVQRVLNPNRIARLTEFAKEKGDYPNSVVLNWVNTSQPLSFSKGIINVSDEPYSAQIIDGQHRIAGITEAMKTKPEIGNLPLAATIYENLSTEQCAELFIAINTEQRPAPKSLVYDLFNLVEDTMFADRDTVRAVDIAEYLNSEQGSPFFDKIKFPGNNRSGSRIQLSTVVNAIKPLLGDAGEFSQMKIQSFERQRMVVFSYLNVLSDKYGPHWESGKNPFKYALGFQAAIDFLRTRLLPICQIRRNFSPKMFEELINITPDSYISRDETKGKQGRTATRYLVERLEEYLAVPPSGEADYEF